ncbi:ATP-binding cassette domain-containing protein [Thalassococcus sp. BH17M4-6]|uniref:ATP-binding cassette domain-containing protein n=1 Tax=Thalassococcus sp. BH17M4-6 TaxID=3413148 RepID=UPI003BF512AF
MATPISPLRPGPLACRDLCFDTDGQRLLHDVTLSLPARGITVVMGPNGAGKSVLLRLLHGLAAPTLGHVLWQGAPLDGAARDRQAMVFQKPVLLRRSVARNVDFVLRARGRKDNALRDTLLARVGLAERGGQPARRLSGGEQQRLALARALASAPDLLFLDEPTASLDPASAQMIEDILRSEVARGTKIVLVTHDIAQARRLADDIAFLHRGRLTEHRGAGAFFNAPASQPARDYLSGKLLSDQT